MVVSLVDGTAPLPDETGVISASNGRVTVLDLFNRPETLAAYWDSLVAGYALDAVVDCEERAPIPPPDVAPLLEALASLVEVDVVDGVGEGHDIHLRTAGLDATALRWDGVDVHVTVFVDDPIAV